MGAFVKFEINASDCQGLSLGLGIGEGMIGLCVRRPSFVS